MDDSKLLRLLHKDPNTGMEKLINEYAGLVYAVVKRKFADYAYISSDIEDCVADVFSEFYTQLDKYDPKISSIKSYLCVIARHNAIDLLRKRGGVKERISIDDDEGFLELADDRLVENEMDKEVLRRELFVAISALGELDSQIIFRKFYFRQSSKEISEALNMTVSNVDTRTHRALAKLRKLFGGKNL